MTQTQSHRYLMRIPKTLWERFRKEAFRRQVPISKVLTERLENDCKPNPAIGKSSGGDSTPK